jgi:hypothetical protein
MRETKMYFASCSTIDEAKKVYRTLAFLLHPDKGGTKEQFQDLQNQFESFRPTEQKYQSEYSDFKAQAADFMEIIERLRVIPSIEVELIGSWIWVSGDTRPVSDRIKAAADGTGFKTSWNRARSCWQIHSGNYQKRSGELLSKEEISARYGSTKYEQQNIFVID